VDDQVGSAKGGDCLGAQEAMGVGNEADQAH
jgi:hypothetical protein